MKRLLKRSIYFVVISVMLIPAFMFSLFYRLVDWLWERNRGTFAMNVLYVVYRIDDRMAAFVDRLDVWSGD